MTEPESGSFDLARFVTAQDEGGSYERALAELRAGRKHSHWMWFVFPQVAGLGLSATSRHYAISGLDEARAYLAHPVLGPRLRACVWALVEPDAVAAGRSADQVFGGVDAQKLRSSATLFARADPSEPLFAAVLDRFFTGRSDERTEGLLGPR